MVARWRLRCRFVVYHMDRSRAIYFTMKRKECQEYKAMQLILFPIIILDGPSRMGYCRVEHKEPPSPAAGEENELRTQIG